MTNPRQEAFKALREAESAARCIPDAMTVPAIEQVRHTLDSILAAQRRALEWLDAVETP